MKCRPYLVTAVLIIFGACGHPTPREKNQGPYLEWALHNTPGLQTGDVIFTSNNTLWGEVVRTLSSRDDRYSHVGILIVQHTALRVLHAAGSPTSPDGAVRIDSLKDFLKDSTGVGVYRAQLDSYQRDVVGAAALQMGDLGLAFNASLRMGRSDALYCTELVWKLYRDAIGVDLVPEIGRISGFPVIAVDDLTLSPLLEEVTALPPAPEQPLSELKSAKHLRFLTFNASPGGSPLPPARTAVLQ